METRSNYAIVGAVVVALVVAMFIGVIWLARFSGSDNQHFDIFFKQSINGLAVGSPVAFNGVPVGKIEEIKLLPETPQFVRVRITIAEDVPVLKGTTAVGRRRRLHRCQPDFAVGRHAGRRTDRRKRPVWRAGHPVAGRRLWRAARQCAGTAQQCLETDRAARRAAQPRKPRSIAGILRNTDKATGALADRAPEIAQTIIEARTTLRAATATLQKIDALAGSADAAARPAMASR